MTWAWYNLLACSIVSFFAVGAGFYEIMLTVPRVWGHPPVPSASTR